MRVDKEEFTSLKQKWYAKLRQEGFQDIETPSGSLKSKDIRTQNYRDKDILIEFYSQLNQYLTDHGHELKTSHYEILRLHCDGIQNIQIASILSCSKSMVKTIIRQCKIEHFGYIPKKIR